MRKRSPAQIEASRLNGAKSRGPRTGAGKVIVAQSARRHGLWAARFALAAGESGEEFEALYQGMVKDLLPCGTAEQEAVAQIVAAIWELRRVDALAAGIWSLPALGAASGQPRLDAWLAGTRRDATLWPTFQRYRTEARRAVRAAYDQLAVLHRRRVDAESTNEPGNSILSSNDKDLPNPEPEAQPTLERSFCA